MKPFFCALALAVLLGLATSARAQPATAFTYQGLLELANAPYTGTADYRFTLFGADGGALGQPMIVSGVEVIDGLFTLPLDFGAVVHGPGRELAIEVRTPAWDGIGVEPAYTLFAQRKELRASPHALSTRGIGVSDDGMRVGIGTDEPLATLEVAGDGMFADGLLVLGGILGGPGVLDQSVPGSTVGAVGGEFWQSFRAGRTGELVALEVDIDPGSSNLPPLQIRIYAGEGTNGPLLGSAGPFETGVGVDRIEFAEPVPVEVGSTYTMLFTPVFNSFQPLYLVMGSFDAYENGRTSVFNPRFDMLFKTFVRGELSLMVDGASMFAGPAQALNGVDVQGPATFRDEISTLRPLNALGGVLARGGAPGNFGEFQRGYAFAGPDGDNDSGLFSLGDGWVSLFTDSIERVRLDRRNIAIGAGFFPLNNVHIRHQSVGAGWGIRIQSEAQSTFQTGMRVSNDGFFDITNNIGGSNFARLTSSGVWTTVSDERAKEDIHHLDGALDRAMRLDPVAYRYKGTDTEEIGFTAQNVAEHFPSLVAHGEDLMTLNYSGLSTVAIAALQELKAEKDAEIERLRTSHQAQIDELRAQLRALTERLAPPAH